MQKFSVFFSDIIFANENVKNNIEKDIKVCEMKFIAIK